MLHQQSIDTGTLELLIRLMDIQEFKELNLVGGTSLALQIGHRKSIDLDLFGSYEIDEYSFAKVLNQFNEIKLLNKSTNIQTYLINGIKVDFVNYPYEWLEPCKTFDGIRLATVTDIAAMKLAAITGRGTKKDFVDIYFLFDYFTLSEMLKLYNKKFPDGSEFLVLKSLTYFVDAEEEELPFMLKDIEWNNVKSKTITETKRFLNSQ